MIRHYFAQRSRGGDNPLRIGTIAIGAIYYIQPDHWWRERFRGAPTCREPWIVEAFFNGTVEAAFRDPSTRQWRSLYIKGRSDVALIRSLRTGRSQRIAVRILQLHDDEGLSPGPQSYPTLPPAAIVDGYLRHQYGLHPSAQKTAESSAN
ncbi:hypothetical protein GCM10010909_15920 [Acidocella aquatica]|uniref:Uncharacterized protein n=1 Tax=Acidocella aquatica TaxID=1922313 RepID=A0ABQ6A6J8_9PROT|nr:hypothetical protein [Acidocella aquatica]GLR66912.1 hypothetical protein GCM10010909_15920 [Acidocella aquatica]